MKVPTAVVQGWAWLRQPPLWFTLVACAAILAARRPDLVHTPQFWAEDGFFFEGAFRMGWDSLRSQYAGYLHTVPRLVALLARACDPAWVPAIFVGSAAVLTLWVAALTQSSRSPLPRHIGFALAVVLVPDGFEVLLNIVNLQWILAGGLLLVMVSADAKTPWQHTHDALAAVVLGLTGPFSVALAPIFLLRAWQRRSVASWVLAALVTACGAMQAWLIVHHSPAANGGPFRPELLLAVSGMRVGASLLVGYKVMPEFALWLELLLGVLTVAAVVALAVRRDHNRTERIWLGLGFFAVLASVLFRGRLQLADLQHVGFGGRYFFPVQMAMVWLVLAAMADPRRSIARTAAVVAVWMLAINIPRLREGAFEDQHWENYVEKMRSGEQVRVPINPGGWSFELQDRRPEGRR